MRIKPVVGRESPSPIAFRRPLLDRATNRIWRRCRRPISSPSSNIMSAELAEGFDRLKSGRATAVTDLLGRVALCQLIECVTERGERDLDAFVVQSLADFRRSQPTRRYDPYAIARREQSCRASPQQTLAASTAPAPPRTSPAASTARFLIPRCWLSAPAARSDRSTRHRFDPHLRYSISIARPWCPSFVQHIFRAPPRRRHRCLPGRVLRATPREKMPNVTARERQLYMRRTKLLSR
jgi:hypothetical protein